MIRQSGTIISILVLLLTGGCATLPENFDRPITHAYTDTDNTGLGKGRREEKIAHPGESGFRLLEDGLDAFVARAALSQYAERSIDAQYFLIHNDLVGKLFIDQLLKAADRGVRVRLLVDDYDLEGRDIGAAILDSHPNVEVRLFNPFSRKAGRTRQLFTRLGSVTRRMHNKSFIVDNQKVILGGRNIGDQYFEADPDIAFGDLDVLAMGPLVREVSDAFDLYWNNELAYPVSVLIDEPPAPDEIEKRMQLLNDFIAEQEESAYMQALKNSELASQIREGRVQFSWGDAVVIYDQPEKLKHGFDKTEYHLTPQLKPYVEDVKNELILFSPYFVPGKKGTAFLTQLSRQGVRVRILTNSLASLDHDFVHAGYSKYRKDLLRAGVELYEVNIKMSKGQFKEKAETKPILHAKSFVFDRKQTFIGSLNLDPRSIVHNTEIGVVITVPEIAEGMADWFDQNVARLAFRLALETDENGNDKIVWHGRENGEQVTYDRDPHTGFWKRFFVGFLRFLPIESQL